LSYISTMNAMIFAAGLGTRLRPYTNDRPKALVEVNGKPLIEWAIRRLLYCGFNNIVINVHHFADQLTDFLKKNKGFGARIAISDERDLLLDTGGAIKKAQSLLGDEPFLIYNTDILSDYPLDELYQDHLNSKALASLLVRQRQSSRYLLFDESMQLCGWKNVKTGAEKIAREALLTHPFAFSGIHVVSPAIFELFPETAVFSIIDVYLKAAESLLLRGVEDERGIWLDVGKIPALAKAEQLVREIHFWGLE
jgi:NDP-sugar pyrophosphorylase family protein